MAPRQLSADSRGSAGDRTLTTPGLVGILKATRVVRRVLPFPVNQLNPIGAADHERIYPSQTHQTEGRREDFLRPPNGTQGAHL